MSHHRSVKLCVLFSTLATACWGAGLSGRITDPGQRVVPDAQVQATNRANGATARGTTGPEGIYSFPGLAPGSYDLEVSKEGFRTSVRPNVRVHVAGATVEDMELSVGEVRERVDVEGQFELIDTETATVGTVIDHAMVEALPLNGRSFQSLLELTPGVVLARSSIVNPGQFSINGQRTNDAQGELRGLLRRMNPTAKILETERGAVPLKEVLGTGLFDMEKRRNPPGGYGN